MKDQRSIYETEGHRFETCRARCSALHTAPGHSFCIRAREGPEGRPVYLAPLGPELLLLVVLERDSEPGAELGYLSAVDRYVLERLTGESRLAVLDHPVDDAVHLGLLGAHEVVALGVLGDLVERLAGVLGDDLVEPLANVDDLLGVDLNVRGLALEPAGELVDEDLQVRAGPCACPERRPRAAERPCSSPRRRRSSRRLA